MSGAWQTELWLFAAIAGVGGIAGYVAGHLPAGLAIGVCGYLVWHLWHLGALVQWVNGRGEHGLPNSAGAWRYLYQCLNAERSAAAQETEKLRRSRDRHRLMTRALPEAAVMLDASGQIEMINRAAQRLLGFKEPADLGQTVTNLIRDPQLAELLGDGDYTRTIEVDSPLNESEKLSLQVVPYDHSGKRLMLAQDVTRLSRLEQVRRDFIANVSHELKSPLTVIIGYVESMQVALDIAESWRKPLDQIEQQAHRMRNIVEDLLKLASLETAEAEDDNSPVGVPDLIRSILNEGVELAGDKDLAFSADIDEDLGLKGSYHELYSAFSNVVFNAVRYTLDHGSIRLRWYTDAKGRARFEVEDSGIGVAPQHIERLTERFYRVDTGDSRSTGGTGLGLAIVKHVLIRHNGDLIISSDVGVGSTFTCRLPPRRVVALDRAESA